MVIFSYLPLQIDTSTTWGINITASQGFGAALRQDGSLSSWGLNDKGQLGNGTVSNTNLPNGISCPTTLQIQAQNFENINFTIFPNPASNIVNIQPSLNKTISNIKITDLLGKTIMKSDDDTKAINIEKLSKGLYIIAVMIDNKSFQQKFIKN
jgi:alpha-tubulin suppressor-like RCC1 family protein